VSTKQDSVAIYKVRKTLSELSNIMGRGTELVTLYVPPKKPIHEVIGGLREEYGTASNIKSDTTRTHVQDALTKTMQRLKLYKSTPENGLVIFCGAIPGPGGPGNEVIQLFEIIPPKPVTTYLYRCVAPQTRILLDDGTEETINDLKGCWSQGGVLCFAKDTKSLSRARIADHIETKAGDRKTFRLTSESGRTIIATEDHPFFTPKGWVRLDALRSGDLVCVNPVSDFEPAVGDGSPFTSGTVSTILDEKTLRSLDFPSTNLELTMRRLKARGILPLDSSNPRLPTIARILGHLFSDGSFTHNIEIRNGREYSHFTVDLCVGTEADIAEITNDLTRLGVKAPRAFPVAYEINMDGRRSYLSHTFHMKVRNIAFCTLLRALGAPLGRKVKKGTTIPDWLMNAPHRIQREFLAAYMGGNGETPRMLGSNPASAIRLTFHWIEVMAGQGKKHARDLETLFANFGVRINSIEKTDGYVTKDGLKTCAIEIRFSSSEENFLNICHRIGYRYCGRKATQASFVGEYLRIKSILRERATSKMIHARGMKACGMTTAQISNSLGICSMTTSQWSNAKITQPITRLSHLPSFNSWRELATQNLPAPLLWESITSIEPVPQDRVMDLTIDGKDHNFFANGFLVHNCDDHFHLEILRDMLREEQKIGILAVDATEAGLGIVSGDDWKVVAEFTSGVSGKTRAGGQSARRYERLREMELTDYFNRLAKHCTEIFLDGHSVKGLIVGGPGPTKDDFLKQEYLDYRLQKNILGVIDTGYSGGEGVREIVEKSGKLLENVRVIEEKKMVQNFLKEVNEPNGLAIYGINDIIENMKKSAVQTVIIVDDNGLTYLRATCSKCANVREKIVSRSELVEAKQNFVSTPCPNCSSTEIEIYERDLIEYLADLSLESGAKVEVISGRTEDGMMLKNFGGVGAFLRYRTQ
jgi:peptide chain release factor 1